MKAKDKRLLALILTALLIMFNVPIVSFALVTEFDYPGGFGSLITDGYISATQDNWDEVDQEKTYSAPSGNIILHVIVHAGGGSTLYKIDDSTTPEEENAAPYLKVVFNSDRTQVTITEVFGDHQEARNVSFIGLKYGPAPSITPTPTIPETTPTPTIPETTPTPTIPETTPTPTIPETTPTPTIPETTPTPTIPETTPTPTIPEREPTPTEPPDREPTPTEPPDREPTPTEPPEPTIPDENPPEAAPEILEDIVPLAPVVLPKTGEIPAAVFYGFGSMLSALGVFIKRKR